MANGLHCGEEESLAGFACMTPTQLNEIILDKLTLLSPRFEMLRDDLVKFQLELTNGMIHWSAILERAKREC